LAQWFNVLNCRNSSQSALSLSLLKNKWLLGGLVIGNILQVLVVFWRPMGDIFHTVAIGVNEIFILGMVASLVMWSEEFRKYFYRKKMILS
jgi:magnesium-transporting ATPase (P-type)